MSKTQRPEPILITLCRSCASQFYSANRYSMKRADEQQLTKEDCTYCGARKGFDYLLYPKKETTNCSRRKRRYLEGGACECFVRTEY